MRLGLTRSRSLKGDSLQWGPKRARQYTRWPAASFEYPMTAEFHVIDLKIPEDLAGQRLDVALARLLPDHSRTRIRGWIDAGQVLVGRLPCKPRDVVEAGSQINVRMTVEVLKPGVLPENIPLTLAYEDGDV